MKKTFLFTFFYACIVLNTSDVFATDNAAIIAFNPPTGAVQRGQQMQATVTIKNTGSTTRSFWVGLSFAGQNASLESWPVGWYDVYPIETSVLNPQQSQTVLFSFILPAWLPMGDFRADTAVWEGFDAENYLMQEPSYDSVRNVTSLSLLNEPSESDLSNSVTFFPIDLYATNTQFSFEDLHSWDWNYTRTQLFPGIVTVIQRIEPLTNGNLRFKVIEKLAQNTEATQIYGDDSGTSGMKSEIILILPENSSIENPRVSINGISVCADWLDETFKTAFRLESIYTGVLPDVKNVSATIKWIVKKLGKAFIEAGLEGVTDQILTGSPPELLGNNNVYILIFDAGEWCTNTAAFNNLEFSFDVKYSNTNYKPIVIIPDIRYEVHNIKEYGIIYGAGSFSPMTWVTGDLAQPVKEYRRQFNIYPASTITLTATSGSHGSINPSGAILVESGDDKTFYATPDPDYVVDKWHRNGLPIQGSDGLGFWELSNIQANITVLVTFKVDTSSSGDLIVDRPAQNPYKTGDNSVMCNGTSPSNTNIVCWENALTGDSDCTENNTGATWSDRVYLDEGSNLITFTAYDASDNPIGSASITVIRSNNNREEIVNTSRNCGIASGQPKDTLTGDVFIGYDETYGYLNERGLIKFDLPSLPLGYTFNSATFSAKTTTLSSENTGGNQLGITLALILENWDESSATWNDQLSPDPYDQVTVNVSKSTNTYSYWNITEIAKKWYNGSSNYGLMMFSQSENCGYDFQRYFQCDKFSLKINYTIETTLPQITITSPTNNPSYTTGSSSILLSGTASDNYQVNRVEYLNQTTGATGTATLNTPSWSCSVPLTAGLNTISVIAFDMSENSDNDTISVLYLTSPTNVSATNDRTDCVFIQWDSVTGAGYYRVYRSESVSGTKTPISEWIDGLSFVDSTATIDVMYYYWVTAAADNLGTGESQFSGSVTGKKIAPPPPPKPASISYPSSSSTGQYIISWFSSDGATSYQLQVSDDGGNTWSEDIYSAQETSYPDNVVKGNYRYRVKATNSGGSSDWTTGTGDCVVYIPPPDTIPDQFTFTDLPDVELNTIYTSNQITVSGFNAETTISTTGGDYSVNEGPYTNLQGKVNNGNTVTVRQTSSGSYSTPTNVTLTIGGESDTFTVTTKNEPHDTIPPEPDPMTWATEPYTNEKSSITMIATTATDSSGVEYYFDETSGNPGGSDSDWQDSPIYTDDGLQAGTTYTYQVKARDKSTNHIETDYSILKSATPQEQLSNLCKFGSFDGLKNVKLTLNDGDNDITFSLTGGGHGEINCDDLYFSTITLFDTNDKSVLTISTKGNVGASVGNIICQGPLKGISAKYIDIDGIIEIGPSTNPKASVTIAFDETFDLKINSKMPIKSLSAKEWFMGSLNAPSVGKITIKVGRAINDDDIFIGDLGIDVNVDGNIGTVKVDGELSGEWLCNAIKSITANTLSGDLILKQKPDSKIKALGNLTVKSYIEDSQILTSGHIGTVKTGAMLNSTCFAGVANPSMDLPDAEPSSFNEVATIKSITIKGIKDEYDESIWGICSSNIAAANIMNAALCYPDNFNIGVPFGLSAGFIKSVKIKDEVGKQSFKNLDKPEDSKKFDDIDLEIRLY